MIKIDSDLLERVGLGDLPTDDADALLKHIYESLEMRVGIALADEMSNKQLEEFEVFFESKDDAGAFAWLESSFPDYKLLVQGKFDLVVQQLTEQAPLIRAAASDRCTVAVAA
jgi:hypothetical protein